MFVMTSMVSVQGRERKINRRDSIDACYIWLQLGKQTDLLDDASQTRNPTVRLSGTSSVILN